MSSIITEEMKCKAKALGFSYNKITNNFTGRVLTKNGKITSSQHKCIAEAAELFGSGTMALTTRLTIDVEGIPYEKIEDFREYISKENLETGGTGKTIRPIIACKGLECRFGIQDTSILYDELNNRIYKVYEKVILPHKFKIAAGSCPNNCIKANSNDLGIVGQYIPNINESLCRGCKNCNILNICPKIACNMENNKLKIDSDKCVNCGRCKNKCVFKSMEKSQSGFKIYIGGTLGKKPSPGIALNKIFESKEEVFDVIEKAILLYKDQGISGEKFSKTIERVGFENVEKQLLNDDLLHRKSEIINANLKLPK